LEQQMSLVNGDFTRQLRYRWMLLPKEAGEFEIGPAEIEVDGEVHRSTPFKVRVLPASAKPRSSRPAFVTAGVSNPRPYVGEQVLYLWRFYRRARIADPRLDALDLGGFLVEDLGALREFRATEGGLEYEVSEIRKALFAQRPGTITIPPSRLLVQLVHSSRRTIDPFGRTSPLDEFFGQMRTESLSLATEPLSVTARALPPAPADFSGLVGDFTIDASVSATQMPVGESLTQTIVVSGSGNLHLMGDLPLDELDGFKIYRDQPKVEIERSGARLQGKKTFTRALVPLRAGQISIPETRLVYFDPARESYVTAAALAIALDVVPGAGNEDLQLTESLSPGGGKVAVRILADDLLPIHRGVEIVGDDAMTALMPVLLAFPPLAYLALLVARRRAHRLASDVGLRRRRTALRRALGAMGGAELGPRDASGILRRYIGDRVGAEGGALTARECVAWLEARGASAEMVAEVGALLSRLEAADFGGGGASGAPVPVAELRAMLERLDRDLRRER
jgi:hypothetical protein